MTNNRNLGRLVSEHHRGDKRRAGLYGCGTLLIVPFACGIWGAYAAITGEQTEDAQIGLALSAALAVASVGLLATYILLIFFSPLLLKKYKLEIYEHGLKLSTPFKSQVCLWSEIKSVNPMLLTTHANRSRVQPSDFKEHGNTEYGGIYEVYKTDGSKILVSRQYSNVKQIDDALKPRCVEVPEW